MPYTRILLKKKSWINYNRHVCSDMGINVHVCTLKRIHIIIVKHLSSYLIKHKVYTVLICEK